MYIHICMYTYMYTCISIRIYTYTYTCVFMDISVGSLSPVQHIIYFVNYFMYLFIVLPQWFHFIHMGICLNCKGRSRKLKSEMEAATCRHLYDEHQLIYHVVQVPKTSTTLEQSAFLKTSACVDRADQISFCYKAGFHVKKLFY